MANITRIKSKDEPKKQSEKTEKVDKKLEKKQKKLDKKQDKKAKSDKRSNKKPFILIRPLVYFFRYLRDSWREIRQVRWPSRKATWKLFFAILIYTLLFGAIIMLLDVFFTWIFNLIIG